MSEFAADFTAHRGGSRVAEGSVVAGLLGVTKSFGGTIAVDDVTFDLRSGEVLALLGENGAGKSTCVKLLAGVYRPDRGNAFLDGKHIELHSPLDAHQHGIAVMHQHPGLFEHLSIAENIFVSNPRKNRWGLLDHSVMEQDAGKLLEVVGLAVNPGQLLGRLRTSERQLVEVAKALAVSARVLIMDEPTAALSQHEVDRLFEVVDALRKQRVAMMFVSHRMDEIYRIADRVAVLRDGKLIAIARVSELPRNRAVTLMVGVPCQVCIRQLMSILVKWSWQWTGFHAEERLARSLSRLEKERSWDFQDLWEAVGPKLRASCLVWISEPAAQSV